MPQLTSTGPDRAEPAIQPVRDRGDACPGALRLHPADDGALARIRIPAGLLSARQALALADVAEELGDAHLDITSRGNLQLRGLDEREAPQLASALDGLGLLPAPRHERVRNIVASPLSGLDDAGNAEVVRWATRLDELLCASEAATQLSGRFLFALDDGRGDVAALDPDVTLIALPGDEALLRVGSETEAVLVPAAEAASSALLAADAFLAVAARESDEAAWRVRELPHGKGLFAHGLAERLSSRGVPARCVSEIPVPVGAAPAPGVVEGPSSRCALSVLAPLGRLTSSQWRRTAALAARHGEGPDGEGELRVTPWRGVVLPGLPRESARKLLPALDEAGLITHDGSPWLGVGACTGLPGCARSHRDVRSDAAARITGTGELTEPAGSPETAARPGLLPVYWSGCERRCGRPRGDRVDVVAGEDGYTVAVQAEGSTRKRVVPDGELARAVASARTHRETE